MPDSESILWIVRPSLLNNCLGSDWKGIIMRISEHVHLIRKEFLVTPEVKRYVNIYLIVGKYCYLIDSGVKGSETLIEEYMESLSRKMTDLKGVFLTHSHPDHAGAAAEIKRRTNCTLYAPAPELPWIEHIQKQFEERPIPNFFNLISESIKVDLPLIGGEEIMLEEGITIRALSTKGHSHGSMSFILNDEVIFTGDAIPVADDLPIFVGYEETLKSLDLIQSIPHLKYYCPAWDEVYQKDKLDIVINDSKEMLFRLKVAVTQVEEEFPEISEPERTAEVLKRANLLRYAGNPLVSRSIDAISKCK